VLPEAAVTIGALSAGSSIPTLAELRSAIVGNSAQTTEDVCECGAPLLRLARFCTRCGKPLVSGSPGKHQLALQVEKESEVELLAAWNEGRVAPHLRQRLTSAIDEIRTTPGFDRLMCVDRLSGLTRMFYQEEAALRVLRATRGRSLLADEVGLVLDEAHYLNDEENVRALETVRSLRKRYFLLLSATPMHNDLGEFHNILTLLHPGHVGSSRLLKKVARARRRSLNCRPYR
jgi:SNF2-related domain